MIFDLDKKSTNSTIINSISQKIQKKYKNKSANIDHSVKREYYNPSTDESLQKKFSCKNKSFKNSQIHEKYENINKKFLFDLLGKFSDQIDFLNSNKKRSQKQKKNKQEIKQGSKILKFFFQKKTKKQLKLFWLLFKKIN